MPAPVVQDAGLLVSELVTNSVVHGRASDTDRVSVRFGVGRERLRIEVSDPGPGFDPERPARDADGPGGYGLLLITQLAEAWGVLGGEETRVWFELRR